MLLGRFPPSLLYRTGTTHPKGESSLALKKLHTAQMHDVYHNQKYKETLRI